MKYKIEYKIVNMDFASLYPQMKDFSKDLKFLAELKEIRRKQILKERREERRAKLEKINNL